jgi:hypothetical protein
MAQAAEGLKMRVSDAGALERRGQQVPIELGVMPRARHGADIQQPFDMLLRQEGQEILERARGMAASEDLRHRFSA